MFVVQPIRRSPSSLPLALLLAVAVCVRTAPRPTSAAQAAQRRRSTGTAKDHAVAANLPSR